MPMILVFAKVTKECIFPWMGQYQLQEYESFKLEKKTKS